MTHIIGLVGLIGSGKGTVAELFSKAADCTTDSFAKPLKDLTASIFGWPRHLLEGDTSESRDLDPYLRVTLQKVEILEKLPIFFGVEKQEYPTSPLGWHYNSSAPM